MWTPQERQAIPDATDFIGTRTHGETSTGVLDGADPNSVILGLIVVADYAIGIAAQAMHCSRAELISRIAREADGLE